MTSGKNGPKVKGALKKKGSTVIEKERKKYKPRKIYAKPSEGGLRERKATGTWCPNREEDRQTLEDYALGKGRLHKKGAALTDEEEILVAR